MQHELLHSYPTYDFYNLFASIPTPPTLKNNLINLAPYTLIDEDSAIYKTTFYRVDVGRGFCAGSENW